MSYNVREAWINGFINGSRPFFDAAGSPLPLNIRAGVGFPINGYRATEIGQIIFPESSSDGHYEIFLNPRTQAGDQQMPDARLADILTHELIHAACDANANHRGHRKPFKTLATALGLIGDMRSTVGGAEWHRWAAPILAELGPMPYGHIDIKKQHKTVPTYGWKVECPDCGWLARVSKKHVEACPYLNCPNPDCNGIMIATAPNNPN